MRTDSFLYNPRTYTITSLVIGYLLIGDLSAVEQNALGNFLMTIGQVLENNAAIQQVIEEKFKGNTYNINSKKYKQTGNPIMDNDPLLEIISKDKKTLEELRTIVNDLKNKIDRL